MRVYEVTVTAGDWTFCPHVVAASVEDAIVSAVSQFFEEWRGIPSGEIFATCDGVRYSISRQRQIEYKATRV